MLKPAFLTGFLFASFLLAAQQNRWFVTVGAGPSYSLFYHSGGWVRDFGSANVNNLTETRTAWSFSHFAEVERRFRNPRFSLRLGYSLHRFAPRFEKEYTNANGTTFWIHTREADRNLYLQSTLHYALLQGVNRLEAGTGIYIQKSRHQGINYYDWIVVDNGPAAPTLFVEDYTSEEAGFPFNLDYLRTLKNGNAVGCRLNFNYTQSVQTAEHLSLAFFFKMRLGRL